MQRQGRHPNARTTVTRAPRASGRKPIAKSARVSETLLKQDIYYKCEDGDCRSGCLICAIWQLTEDLEIDCNNIGNRVRVMAVNCACVDFRDWVSNRAASPCNFELQLVESRKGGKTYRKSVARCLDDGRQVEYSFFDRYKSIDSFGRPLSLRVSAKPTGTP